MNEKIILDFFEFNERTIKEVSYLIQLGTRLDIIDKMKEQLYQFDKKSHETTPVFYKRMFLGEISWRLTELVCAEYYPEIAIDRIEDFGLFFQYYILDNEVDNDFYNFLIRNDLSKLSNRETVELIHTTLKKRYETYFETDESSPDINMDIIQMIESYRPGNI